jgi:ATP-binding cassette, subfamily B, bacterial MsbA
VLQRLGKIKYTMGLNKIKALFRDPYNVCAMGMAVRLLKEEQWTAFTLLLVAIFSGALDVGVLSVFSFGIAVLSDSTETLLRIFPNGIRTGLRSAFTFISKDTGPSLLFVVLLGLGVLLQLVKSSLDYLRAVLGISLTASVNRKLIQTIAARVVHADYSDIQDISTGELTALLTHQESMGRLVRLFLNSSVAALMFGVYISVAMLISWKVSLGTVLYALVLMVGMAALTRRIRWVALRVARLITTSSVITAEIFSLPRVIRFTSAQESVMEEIQRVQGAKIEGIKSIGILRAIMTPSVEIFSVGIIATILLLSVFLLGYDSHKIVEIFAVLLIAFRAKPHLMIMNDMAVSFVKSLPSAAAIMSFLDQTRGGNLATRTGQEIKFEEKIELAGVALAYRSGASALRNINLSIHRGQRLAILGRSGAGKSSLIDLIIGMRLPTSGEILVDGKELSSIDSKDWMRHIGVVDQETILVRGTIQKNISFGMADIQEADIVEAARASKAHDFIVDLPHGYNTDVGERGVSLSGGQRQRIALARALIRKPAILLLDEAMSALDGVTEGELNESLKGLPQDTTVVIVTHRLSSLDLVDDAIILDKGEIFFSGSAKEASACWQKLSDMALQGAS